MEKPFSQSKCYLSCASLVLVFEKRSRYQERKGFLIGHSHRVSYHPSFQQRLDVYFAGNPEETNLRVAVCYSYFYFKVRLVPQGDF